MCKKIFLALGVIASSIGWSFALAGNMSPIQQGPSLAQGGCAKWVFRCSFKEKDSSPRPGQGYVCRRPQVDPDREREVCGYSNMLDHQRRGYLCHPSNRVSSFCPGGGFQPQRICRWICKKPLLY